MICILAGQKHEEVKESWRCALLCWLLCEGRGEMRSR